MKLPLLTLILLIFYSQEPNADVTAYGLQCSGVATAELKSCLKKESGKIDEANLPNEVIIASDEAGKESLLKLVKEIASKKTNEYTQKLLSLIPAIESSVAAALIIQYEDEPQLYYYIVDQSGTLIVIFDGINSADITDTYGAIFRNEHDIFYLKSTAVSNIFIEWLEFLKED